MIMHNYLAMHINNKDDIVNRNGSMIMHNYLALHINNKDDIVKRHGSMIMHNYLAFTWKQFQFFFIYTLVLQKPKKKL